MTIETGVVRMRGSFVEFGRLSGGACQRCDNEIFVDPMANHAVVVIRFIVFGAERRAHESPLSI